MSELREFLKFIVERKDRIIKTERTNVVRKRVGYSEYTQWDTTVSYDTIQTVDFEALIDAIDDFSETFKEDKLPHL
jgi:hypothetical protein